VTRALLRDLAWLPPAPDSFKGELRALTPNTPELGATLQRLATHSLDINQLTRLARVLGELRSAGRDGQPLAPLTPFRLGVLSNATTQLLTPALVASAARHGLDLEVVEAPYDQVLQTALDAECEFQRARPDAVLLALDLRALPLRSVASQHDASARAVEAALSFIATVRDGLQRGCGATCIAQTLARPVEAEFGHLDLALAGTRRQLLDRFNRDLANQLAGTSDVLFDVGALAESVGLADWHDPVQWHLAKLPFAQSFVPLYAEHVARLIAALRGKSRRCLVLDLDNTLWGGVIADDGLENIVLGQGDPTGEAFLAVQETALALRDRGVVLAVCSKNTDANAILPFREHPDMLLRERHIAVFQANFRDKASNLKAIADTLNLGVDSLVLLDDNPAEREQVRRALPGVGIPELPADPAYYARTLMAAGYFEATAFSSEDRARAEMYEANAQRVAVREQVADLASYLESLEMVIDFAPFDEIGRERIAQLVNKSNQFNLTTRRYSVAEIEALERDRAHRTWQIRLRDRFGDNGMISVVICRVAPQGQEQEQQQRQEPEREGERSSKCWEIDTWLMSCRVLGRRVEEAVLNEIVGRAAKEGAETLVGRYLPTPRNGLVREHYPKLGFTAREVDAETGAAEFSLSIPDYEPRLVPMLVTHSGS